MSDAQAVTQGMALTAPADTEIESLRQRGAIEVAHRREVSKLKNQIAGTEWGKGLSIQTQSLIAEFAKVVRANVLTHIDVLGGTVYLNSAYWIDLANQQPLFHHYEQRDLSPSVEVALRERAKRQRAAAAELPVGEEKSERIRRALDIEDEADDVALARAKWSPREGAIVVIETSVFRYVNAVLALIQEGKVPEGDGYVVKVMECNWAGGFGVQQRPKKAGGTYTVSDPIGDADPSKTARTRSLRRALTKAFSAWMSQYDRQIEKAEEYMEAEFEVISSSPARPAHATLEIGSGEVVEVATGEVTQSVETQAELPVAPVAEEKDDFDYKDATKRIMATFRDAGIKDRQAWSKANNLSESTKEWKPDDFRRAWTLLVDPVRIRVRELAGGDLEDICLRVLKKSSPDFLREWNAVLGVLEAEQSSDEEADDAEGDGELPLQL